MKIISLMVMIELAAIGAFAQSENVLLGLFQTIRLRGGNDGS